MKLESRRWPQALLLCAMTWLLVACGGGGGGSGTGSTGSAPGSPDGDPATAVPHAASLAAISAAWGGLSHQNPANDAEQMLTVIKALPDVIDAGISAPGFVWFIYSDGTPGAVTTIPVADAIENVPRVAREARGLPAAAASIGPKAVTNVPLSRKVYLHDGLVNEDGRTEGETVAVLKSMFEQAGYQVASSAFTAPADLLQVKDASVLYMDTHGGIGKRGRGPSETFAAIATAVPVTPENLLLFKKEIDNGEIGYIGVPVPIAPASYLTGYRMMHYLFITWRFIENHMTFTQGAMVFLNGCFLGDASMEVAQLRDTFFRLGVTNYVGWDNLVSWRYVQESALYLFDRLLGANALANWPTSPPNRPFDIAAVLNDMRTRKHVYALLQKVSGDNSLPLNRSLYIIGLEFYATLKNQIAPATSANEPIALRPFISGLRVENRTKKLIIDGYFGIGGPGLLTIGGTDMGHLTNWTGRRLTVSPLPDDGPGSSGEIVVHYDGRVSNKAVLNRWNGVVATVYSPRGVPPPQGPGSPSDARVVTTCTVSLRASPNTFRSLPGGDPVIGATVDDAVIQPGDCSYTAGGHWEAPTFGYDIVGVAGLPALPWITEQQRAQIDANQQPSRYGFVSAQLQAIGGGAQGFYFRMQGYIPPSENAGPLVRTTDRSSGAVVAWPATGIDESAASLTMPALVDASGTLSDSAIQQSSGFFTTSRTAALHAADPQEPR